MTYNIYGGGGSGASPGILTVGGGLGGMADTITIGGLGNPHKFDGMDIRITTANGGYIVSIHTESGTKPQLYIINEDRDLGQELGKIITMHCLTKE
jgi:hypothetical protein